MSEREQLEAPVAKERSLDAIRLAANPGTSDGALKTAEWHRAFLELESFTYNAAPRLLAIWKTAKEALDHLIALEVHCPCGARPESLNTHPHVGGCELDKAIRKLRVALEGE